MTNALLVYPEHPPTYWGANFALEIVGIRAAFPPLGLLTVAAMFPPNYVLRVIDMNTGPLTDSDLEWADVVFTSTMIVQRVSLQDVIDRCNRAGVPVVAGGPHPTTFHSEIRGVDHFVLDEVEETFSGFLEDLEGGVARDIYRARQRPDVSKTPVPRFDLINMDNYHSMGVQFSRGCPFDCEFCDITKLYGRIPRTKSPDQMIAEFDCLYQLGWRGQVFLVDDNFIGNKRDAMNVLPALTEWQKSHGYPFTLCTEATINLARMDALMDAMVGAGFDTVFIGVETPNPKALIKTKKQQNTSRKEDNFLFNAIRKIQRRGMQVQGGFILGLDEDDESVFDAQIEFIQDTGIPVAPIYLLTALKGTDMYNRLESEGRILEVPIGTSSMTLNFRTEMDPSVLLEGYKRVTTTLYDPTLENYLDRCLTLLEHLEPVPHLYKPKSRNANFAELMGVRSRLSAEQVPAYTKFIAAVSRKHPRMLPTAIRLAGMGYHFEKVTRSQIALNDFKEFLVAELRSLEDGQPQRRPEAEDPSARRKAILARATARFAALPDEFRYLGDGVDESLTSFRSAVNERFRQAAPATA